MFPGLTTEQWNKAKELINKMDLGQLYSAKTNLDTQIIKRKGQW